MLGSSVVVNTLFFVVGVIVVLSAVVSAVVRGDVFVDCVVDSRVVVHSLSGCVVHGRVVSVVNSFVDVVVLVSAFVAAMFVVDCFVDSMLGVCSFSSDIFHGTDVAVVVSSVVGGAVFIVTSVVCRRVVLGSVNCFVVEGIIASVFFTSLLVDSRTVLFVVIANVDSVVSGVAVIVVALPCIVYTLSTSDNHTVKNVGCYH